MEHMGYGYQRGLYIPFMGSDQVTEKTGISGQNCGKKLLI